MKRYHDRPEQMLFEGPGSRLYNWLAPLVTRPLHQHVADDVRAAGISGVVLDVGTGPGQLALQLAQQQPALTVWGADVSADMIALARRNGQRAGLSQRVRFEVNENSVLPFPDGAVDLIVSTLSMHHWQDLPGMLRELARVVRPGGQVWLYDIQRMSPTPEALTAAIVNLPLTTLQVTPLPLRLGWLPVLGLAAYRLQRSADTPG